MRKVQRPETFEAFYYKKVGLGEGCGCAERIIDVRDLERLQDRRRHSGPSLVSRLWGFLRRRSRSR